MQAVTWEQGRGKREGRTDWEALDAQKYVWPFLFMRALNFSDACKTLNKIVVSGDVKIGLLSHLLGGYCINMSLLQHAPKSPKTSFTL